MDYESLDYNRYRWNRMLLSGFWFILLFSIFLECLYLTITEIPSREFILKYMVKPTVFQLSTLLLAETGLRALKGKYQDYILIITSSLLAYIIVYIHNSINYLLLGLFLPVMVSIFYFHPKKMIFAYVITMASVYLMYWTNNFMNHDITLVGLVTITVMFSCFSLVGWGVIRRGRELISHLKSSFESNQELLVKTIWMDKLAKTDALTELYNHMTFHEYFEKLIEQHEDNGLPLQLALIDIDNFKHVNDTYGHRAGDVVLQRVAKLISSKAYQNDFVARYGGEEFAILFTDKPMAEALEMVDKIRLEISRLSHESLGGKPVTVSIGVGEYSASDGKERFFNRVDAALYKAKNTGKNKTVIAAADIAETQLA
ncbi:GGDEF domain-containing protein [Paenibacillus sepulcri]|uniref:Diguanylate cyclase n=1 Tax=Paenibacillus sepulcri TaxID=359917 RepID=A0ABS7C3G4_9BACL|nr:diguanylate cyclase [Paenibacillus sepulcri]